jgi:hypothetical protein
MLKHHRHRHRRSRLLGYRFCILHRHRQMLRQIQQFYILSVRDIYLLFLHFHRRLLCLRRWYS